MDVCPEGQTPFGR